jgi:NitT/TauT family transport system permease protein
MREPTAPTTATVERITGPEPDNAAPAGGIGAAPRTGVRGRRHAPLLRIRGRLGVGWKIGLGALGVIVVIAVWAIAAANTANSKTVLPTPAATWDALVTLQRDGVLRTALWASLQRVLIGYSISVAIGIVIGIAIGTFASVEAFCEAQIGFLRYIPASALTPVFLIWLGIGESPKIWLIVVGTVFYNVLMIADVARAVPRELLNASYTLGAGRLTVVRRVIVRHSVPGIIDVARINLAAAWLMLVVAELLAAQEGLAFRIIRAQRFREVDTMFAILIVFGVIGLLSDLALRWLRNVSSPWARP